MDWSDYEVDGQLSIFDLIETENKPFNPFESLALRGTGFVDGMKRVKAYFNENHTITENAKFLKKEYGIGGFGSPVKKPCYIHSMDTYGHSGKDLRFAYYDENMTSIESYCTWEQLAKIITDMIENGIYKKEI